jgi:nucleolar protein 12
VDAAEVEAAKLPRTVFVGNVSVETSKRALQQYFKRHAGAVESVRFRVTPVDMDSKMPRKAKQITGKVGAHRTSQAAFVVFAEEAAVERALALNMQELDGHHLRVDRAAPKRDPAAPGIGAADAATYDPPRSVFLGNLAWDTEDEDVIRFFSRAEALAECPELRGALEAVRLVRDPASGLGKGFGFALFKSKAAARAAISLDGQTLGKRPVRVSKVQVVSERVKKVARGIETKGKGSGAQRRLEGKKGGDRAAVGGGGPKDWQGKRTKKDGGVKGRAANKGGVTITGPSAAKGGVDKRDGKRPSVQKRKMMQKKLKKAGFEK